jgi:histidyl-tRNA synthetase
MADKIYRPRSISGFPEWLPEQRLVEQQWMDIIRRCFESYGFCSIETPSVEELDVLTAKGEIDKEIYTIQRLHQEEGDSTESRLGLHFDVTVPFARYAAQHFNDLVFPFKRYQMQKVWRGERPQEGRFREFYQCDIDVINVDSLPLHFDAELPAVVHDILHQLGVGPVALHISNRKILEGYLRGLAIGDPVPVIRILDRLDKIGAAGVQKMLVESLNMPAPLAEKCLALATICTPDYGFVEQVRALGVQHEILDQGLQELAFVMRELAHLPSGAALADLAIARGFDYYTGTVYEGRLVDYPGFGSVVAGGRYEDLAGRFINKKLPGVGISIGLTRLFSKWLAEGKLTIGAKSPTQILVAFPAEERRDLVHDTARKLRARGFNVEMYHSPVKISRQLTYAVKKAIPYVWFPPFEDGQDHEIKDMIQGRQYHADPGQWLPCEAIGDQLVAAMMEDGQ